MELQSNELTPLTIRCQKKDCPHQNRTPDEWASLNLFWCTYCTRIWCEMCWNTVDAHGIIDGMALPTMNDHEKGRVPLQDDQLQRLLVKHQDERRLLLFKQLQNVYKERVALLNDYGKENIRQSTKRANDALTDYAMQVMILEEQERKRRLMDRATMENRG